MSAVRLQASRELARGERSDVRMQPIVLRAILETLRAGCDRFVQHRTRRDGEHDLRPEIAPISYGRERVVRTKRHRRLEHDIPGIDAARQTLYRDHDRAIVQDAPFHGTHAPNRGQGSVVRTETAEAGGLEDAVPQ